MHFKAAATHSISQDYTGITFVFVVPWCYCLRLLGGLGSQLTQPDLDLKKLIVPVSKFIFRCFKSIFLHFKESLN
jgi:hypothetical protein